MKTHSLIAASVLALSLSGYAVAQDTTTTTTQSGTTATTTQPVKPATNSTANQTGSSTDQTQMGQTGTTTTNDQMKTGQSTTTTTTTTDQNAASTSAKKTTTAAMPSEIMVPADQLKDAQIWMANDFIGKTVYSENNENVGDINDVIFSKDGKIVGVVLGVGGFLGIGEKNVLVRLDAIKMVNTSTANNTTSTTTTGTSTDNTTTLGTNATGTATDTTPVNNTNFQLVVATTKEALETAPSFDRKSRTYMTNQ